MNDKGASERCGRVAVSAADMTLTCTHPGWDVGLWRMPSRGLPRSDFDEIFFCQRARDFHENVS
jgi:hypothetical protein